MNAKHGQQDLLPRDFAIARLPRDLLPTDAFTLPAMQSRDRNCCVVPVRLIDSLACGGVPVHKNNTTKLHNKTTRQNSTVCIECSVRLVNGYRRNCTRSTCDQMGAYEQRD